jgi:multidrug efflux pump subunit AcrB
MTKHNQKTGFFGKMATFFLHHKELGVLTFIGIFVWGGLSFVMMPKQYNPEITAPAFQIVTEFPGATSEEVYQLVTKKMEDRVREIPTVDKVMSQSYDGGASVVIAQFFIGGNIEDAKITLTQKLQSNMDDKPMGVSDPQVIAIDPDDVPIMALGLTSDNLSPASLRALAYDIGDKIKRVKGTSVISVSGGEQKELRVEIDPAKLAQNNLTLQRVVDTIRGNNMYIPAGEIKTDGNKYKTTVVGLVETVDDLKNIVINQEGKSVVYLSDIAEISYSNKEKTSTVRFWKTDSESKDATFIAISKLKGTNATNITRTVEKEIRKLQKQNIIPGDVNIEVVRNEGEVAAEATMTLTTNLVSAIIIVAIILLLFLGWRSALIVLISIPLTLSAVFGVGNLAGQTINRITLFALILSLGILVDAAIVVVENIFRLMKENPLENKFKLIAQAVDEVGAGLVLSTTTVTLAFVPMAFVTGMMGPYMGPIPFFVPLTLISSLIIALTIIPYLLNIISKLGKQTTPTDEEIKPNIFLRVVGKLQKKYSLFLTKLLESSAKRKVVMTTVIVALLISLSFPALKIVKFRMLPKADKEQFYLYVDLPQYATIEKTDRVVREIETFIMENTSEQTVSIQSFVGTPQIVDFNGLFKGSDGRRNENQATLKINLTHHKTRNITSEKIVLELRPDLLNFLEKYPDVKVKLIEDPPGPPVLSTYLLKIKGLDGETNLQVAKDLENFTAGVDGVVDVDTTQNEITTEYLLRVKKEEASRAGLSVYDVAMTLRRLLSGEKIAMYHQVDTTELRKAEQQYIVVHTKKDQRDENADLENIYLTNFFGQNIPLMSVVEQIPTGNEPIIYSDERVRAQYVYAEMEKRSVIYAMIDTLTYLVKEYRPFGDDTKLVHWNLFGVTYENVTTGKTLEVFLDGEWKLTLEVFRDLGIAMGVALLMIYFVLVARFGSLVIPLLIMGTIPFSFVGVMPGFAILGGTTGLFFNATSMIGSIALSGIVVNNAIMYLEYLNRLKERGYKIEPAIIKAGKTRLLPIMLTSLTTIFGSLTIISDPVWAGLAWAIIFGLSLSVFLTLIIFPIMYYRFQKADWETKEEDKNIEINNN